MQAVSLVFEHVALVCGVRVPAPALRSSSPQPEMLARTNSGLAAHGCVNAALKLLDDLCMMATGATIILLGCSSLLVQGQEVIPAHWLSRRLGVMHTCVAAASSEAMLKWLRSPALPRYFVLDLLDYLLANTAAIFRCAAQLVRPRHQASPLGSVNLKSHALGLSATLCGTLHGRSGQVHSQPASQPWPTG